MEGSAGTATYVYAYDARGQVTSITEPGAEDADSSAQVTRTMTYDPAGRLISETDGEGNRTDYVRDAMGRVLEKWGDGPGAGTPGSTAGLTKLESFAYDDPLSRLTKHTIHARGTMPERWRAFTYPKKEGEPTTEDVGGKYKVDRKYNGRGKLISEKRYSGSESRTTTLHYDGEQVQNEALADGSTTILKRDFSYDDRGRALTTSEILGSGSTSTRTDTWVGRTLERSETSTFTCSSSSSETRHSYAELDGLGNTISSKPASRNEKPEWESRWLYDASGKLLWEKPAGRPATSYGYSHGQLESSDFGGEPTSFTYYKSGRLKTVKDVADYERTTTWNGRGLRATESFGKSGETLGTNYTYDAFGYVKTVTRGTSTWKFEHAVTGEPTKAVLLTGDEFTYGYDAAGRRTEINRPSGGTASEKFDYDYLDRETKRERGLGPSKTTSWNGSEGTTTTPLGDIVKTVVDARGRTVKKTFRAGGSAPSLSEVTIAYNGADQLKCVTETRSGKPAVQVEMTYDGRGLVEKETRGAESVGWAYRASGERSEVQRPAGSKVVGYDYDGMERLRLITGPVGAQTAVSWEPGGARLQTLSGGGVVERRCYHGTGLLKAVVNATSDAGENCDQALTPLAKFEYGYDNRGNVTTETRQDLAANISEVQSYGYDAADRLTGVLYANGTARLYKLNGDGTRAGMKEVPGYSGNLNDYDSWAEATTSLFWEYDYKDPNEQGALTAILDRKVSQTVQTFEWDKAGRQTLESRGSNWTRRYTWDVDSRLAQVAIEDGSGIDLVTTTTDFEYDYAGRRLTKNVTQATGLGGSSYSGSWVWDGESVLAETLGAESWTYERAGGLVTAVGGRRVMRDGLGSVVGHRDRGSGAVAFFRNDEWGKQLAAPPGGSTAVYETPGTAQPSLAYALMHNDPDTGLSIANQRAYNGELGMFLSVDPLMGNPEEPNSLLLWGTPMGIPSGTRTPPARHRARQGRTRSRSA
ncbi:MAG: hypothetical protein QM765_03755 [Myxococcales bacterium]